MFRSASGFVQGHSLRCSGQASVTWRAIEPPFLRDKTVTRDTSPHATLARDQTVSMWLHRLPAIGRARNAGPVARSAPPLSPYGILKDARLPVRPRLGHRLPQHWRERKLAEAPTRLEDLVVEIDDPRRLTPPSTRPSSSAAAAPIWPSTSATHRHRPGQGRSPPPGRRLRAASARSQPRRRRRRHHLADGADRRPAPRLHPLLQPPHRLAHRRLLQRPDQRIDACCCTASIPPSRAAPTTCSITRSPTSWSATNPRSTSAR
jgi:hypothetical protein